MFSLSQHNRILKRFLFLLIPYTSLRIGFYFYHFDSYRKFSHEEVLKSFLLGIRFDVAAICMLNLPIVLLALIPGKKRILDPIERILFVGLNGLGMLGSLDDYELFSFMGKRLSLDLFVITEDILEQLPQLAVHYWYFPLISILLAFFFYYFDRTIFELKWRRTSFSKWLMGSLFLSGLTFIGMRGGLQHKSINIQTAFTQGENELGHLVLNTPYHFLRTLNNKKIYKIKFFKNDTEAIDVIISRRDFKDGIQNKLKKNVVLLILESFSMEYLEDGYMPFLSELIKEGIYFPYHLANGRRSIEVLPSLLCGLPSLMEDPISKSVFSGNKFVCLPKILKEHRYTNYFFHGGSKGTMGFESYTLSTGFDRYFSRHDYPSQSDFDGTWGIYDLPFMQFAASEISKMKEPFLASIFTLSSHQPYSVPPEFWGKFPKGTLAIHESIGYTDFALKKFFEKARQEPWFKNTIFVITADHTSKLGSQKFQNKMGHYRVPLLVLGVEERPQTLKVSQHSDIPKTLSDLLGVNGEDLPATSLSLWSQDAGGAVNYVGGQEYVYISGNQLLSLKSGAQEEWFYDWEGGSLKKVGKSSDPILKAYLQYFINGLISNNLSLYR